MLKIKQGFSLRNILDAHLVMGNGKDAYIPKCIMSVNETGEFLWNELEKGSDIEALAQKMAEIYDVDCETAKKDVERFITQLLDKGLICEC